MPVNKIFTTGLLIAVTVPHESEKCYSVALVKNGRGREVPLVTVDGSALGILARESEMKLRERNLLNGKGFTFVARLENSPPTTAQVRVKPAATSASLNPR